MSCLIEGMDEMQADALNFKEHESALSKTIKEADLSFSSGYWRVFDDVETIVKSNENRMRELSSPTNLEDDFRRVGDAIHRALSALNSRSTRK